MSDNKIMKTFNGYEIYDEKARINKVNLPIDSYGNVNHGNDGQVLISKGNGKTEWKTPSNIDGGTGQDGASAYDIAVTHGFEGNEEEWLESLKGKDGSNGTDGKDGTNGTDGKDGIGVSSTTINDKGELVLVYSNGTEVNLGTVVGKDGTNGADGKNGVNGVSPKIVVEKIEGGHGIMVTDYTGTQSFEVMDGQNGVDGKDGYTPVKGVDYFDGQDGAKGEKGDKGETGAQGEKGDKGDVGAQGVAGKDGKDGVSVAKTEINNKGELVITLSDNTVSNLGVIIGAKGEKGDKGDTGEQGEQGISGVYIGSGDMPEGYNVQIDIDGEILDVVTKEELSQLSETFAKQTDVDSLSDDLKTVFTAIPKVIYIVVGNEFKMYYKNVLSHHTDRLWLGYTSGITVKRYSEYLSIIATESMSKSVNWKIYDNAFNILASGTIQVIATENTTKMTNVLVIGDSTVTQSNAISQKLLDCYSESGGSLTLLGTKGTSPALHEGRTGWTSTKYCTVSDDNPFYNNGFDFSYYMTQQGYSGVNIVVIQLGINDIFSMTHENFDSSTTLNNLDTMIASILAYDSNIKVIVNLISVPNGNGTSFTDTYNTTQIDFVYLVNTIRLSDALIEHFYGNTSVTISPNNCVLDATTDLNDGVHPNATGYAKLGQTIYETINGIFGSTESGDGGEDTGELWDAGSRSAKENTYKPATTTGTFSNDYYYYPAAYTGALANNDDYKLSNVSVGSNTLQFSCVQSAFGIFVPFIGLDSSKTYRFTVNPTVEGFRVYLVNYDSTGVYVNNAIIVDKTTGLTTYDFTPTEGYQQGFCFACLTATKNVVGIFTELSLTEVTE